MSCFIEISVLNINGVDPDLTPLTAVFDLSLHCWSISRLWVAHKWVNYYPLVEYSECCTFDK